MKSKILIVCLFVFNILLLFKIVQLSNKITAIQKISIMDFKEPFKNSFLTNGKLIQDINLRDLRGKIVNLKNFLGNKRSLLIFYSEVSCNTCVDSLIEGCNLLVNKSRDKNTILGIAYSKDINYLRRFTRINNIQFPFLFVDDAKVVKSIHLKTLPVILMIDENHVIINSYYINPSIKELNSTFFEAASVFLKK